MTEISVFWQKITLEQRDEIERLEGVLSTRGERFQALLAAALRLYDSAYLCPVCDNDPHSLECQMRRLLETSAEVDPDDMDDS